MADSGHDELVSQFVAVTNSSAEQATSYLSSNDWDLNRAITEYFRVISGEAEAEGEPEAAPAPAAPAPAAAGDNSRQGAQRTPGMMAYSRPTATFSRPAKKKGLATLSSLGAGRDDDDDPDDDDYEDEDETRQPRDLFAGGEKSGLAVQDPAQGPSAAKKLVDDIIQKARNNASRNDPENPSGPGPSSSVFRGTGQTLGGDGVESRVIPGPESHRAAGRGAPQPQGQGGEERQERTLHLWEDGFSIDDGPLHRFDDPRNTADLNLIRQGRAPLHLMNVRYDQTVDVRLQRHQEAWHQLPRVYRPFAGEGCRLGSPVPGAPSSPAAAPASTISTTTTTASAAPSSAASTVDDSQPTLSLRIQLPDGTRLPARFNTTHTVGDVYQFVEGASPTAAARPWVLATTFPNKDHTDREQVLGDMPEFKKGGTAVVKWA